MMKFYVYLIAIFVFHIVPLTLAAKFNMTCYYDTFSVKRLGTARFTSKDLENALPLCDNIIYGYVGIHPETFRVSTVHQLQNPHFALVKTMKTKYRNVKFILSLGGDRDFPNHDDKYLKLLEATDEIQQRFIQSAREFVLKYQFDGFDLAYQLPRSFTYSNRSYDSRKTALHRHQMTRLIKKLRLAFKKNKLSLTLTVLPNIDAKSYYNVTAIIKSLDFVTLAAFDFSLPHITPHEANYLAPIHAATNGSARFHHANVDYNLQQWKWTKQVPTKKLNLGIAAFGRTWNTTKTLKNPRMPITSLLNGPAPGGPNTRTSGLLAWPEICKKLPKISNVSKKMFGNFAYRPGLTKRDQGLLITYESPNSLVEKVVFAQRNKLRGVALFDLTLDDFRGKCRGERYVMLKTIKGKLN